MKGALVCFLVVLAGGCAASHAPVPLVGPSADVAALRGEWAGSYSSSESGRQGSISFVLRPAGDSAFGEVVMIPPGFNQPLHRWPDPSASSGDQRQAQVLTIRFVHVSAGRVTGTLEPYADPVTGVRLFTTFVGDVKGNTIEGTYTTHLPSGETQTGRWVVERG